MRKLIVSTFLTLDGVMQAPGRTEEDAVSDHQPATARGHGYSESDPPHLRSRALGRQMTMADTNRILRPSVDGWAGYQRLLLGAMGS